MNPITAKLKDYINETVETTVNDDNIIEIRFKRNENANLGFTIVDGNPYKISNIIPGSKIANAGLTEGDHLISISINYIQIHFRPFEEIKQLIYKNRGNLTLVFRKMVNFICPTCFNKFKSQYFLQRHMKTCNNKIVKQQKKPTKEEFQRKDNEYLLVKKPLKTPPKTYYFKKPPKKEIKFVEIVNKPPLKELEKTPEIPDNTDFPTKKEIVKRKTYTKKKPIKKPVKTSKIPSNTSSVNTDFLTEEELIKRKERIERFKWTMANARAVRKQKNAARIARIHNWKRQLAEEAKINNGEDEEDIKTITSKIDETQTVKEIEKVEINYLPTTSKHFEYYKEPITNRNFERITIESTNLEAVNTTVEVEETQNTKNNLTEIEEARTNNTAKIVTKLQTKTTTKAGNKTKQKKQSKIQLKVLDNRKSKIDNQLDIEKAEIKKDPKTEFFIRRIANAKARRKEMIAKRIARMNYFRRGQFDTQTESTKPSITEEEENTEITIDNIVTVGNFEPTTNVHTGKARIIQGNTIKEIKIQGITKRDVTHLELSEVTRMLIAKQIELVETIDITEENIVDEQNETIGIKSQKETDIISQINKRLAKGNIIVQTVKPGISSEEIIDDIPLNVNKNNKQIKTYEPKTSNKTETTIQPEKRTPKPEMIDALLKSALDNYKMDINELAFKKIKTVLKNKNDPIHRERLLTKKLDKGADGFGFTLLGEKPCKIINILPSSPAGQVGLEEEDILVHIEEHNVINKTQDEVKTILDSCSGKTMMIFLKKVLIETKTVSNICPVCNEECKSPGYVHKHLFLRHRPWAVNMKYKNHIFCHNCTKFFIHDSAFMNHVPCNSLIVVDRCMICFLEKPTEKHFAFHNVKYRNSRYKCTRCDNSHDWFKLSQINKHQQRVHKTCGIFECLKCKINFTSLTEIKEHLAKHLDNNDVFEQEIYEIIGTTKIYKCTKCPEIFKLEEYLTNHEHCHQDYLCNVCGLVLKTSGRLIRHSQIHSKEQKFQCDLCDSKFTTKKYLQQHHNIHTNTKEFNCIICNQNFIQRTSLLYHIATHTKEDVFKCGICDIKFDTQSKVTSHMEIHNKDDTNPYKCVVCSKYFTRECNLIVHMQSHRPRIFSKYGSDKEDDDEELDTIIELQNENTTNTNENKENDMLNNKKRLKSDEENELNEAVKYIKRNKIVEDLENSSCSSEN